MKKKSLRFKMMMIGVLAVLVPLLVVGGFSIYKALNALEAVSESQSVEVAKGLAHMANLAVQEELKIKAHLAANPTVFAAATKYADGSEGIFLDRLSNAAVLFQYGVKWCSRTMRLFSNIQFET